MIVDTSAYIAVLLGEPAADRIRVLLAAYGGRVAAPTLVESRVVAFTRGGATALRRIDSIVRDAQTDVVPFDERHAEVALGAYRDFGRGSGHRARLNLGDTYSYALAIVADEPLLYVGDDFAHTDVRSAVDELA